MHSFKDSEGREWLLNVNVSAVKRVRASTGVDLPGLVGGGLGELLQDVVKFVDVLYVLCKDEAEKRGVTDEGFGSSLGGDTLEKASEAFVEELIDFFPAPRRGPLREMLKKARQMDDALTRMQGEEMAAFDPEAEAEKIRERARGRREAASPPTSSDSSGSTPESSDSTPESSPSGS